MVAIVKPPLGPIDSLGVAAECPRERWPVVRLARGGTLEGKGGIAVLVRAAAVAIVALAVSGCANERTAGLMGLGFHGAVSEAPAPAPAAAAVTGIPSGEMKQTLGGKVLSAIALERVTGRKPDPSRFRELH